jgi:hypothetical protein
MYSSGRSLLRRMKTGRRACMADLSPPGKARDRPVPPVRPGLKAMVVIWRSAVSGSAAMLSAVSRSLSLEAA